MKINISKTVSFLLAFIVFLTINIPSIKFFYSSEFVNVILFIGLWVVGIIKFLNKKSITISRSKITFLILFYVLWLLIFAVTMLNSPENITLKYLSQYIVTFLFATGAVLFLSKEEIPKILNYQILWALFLAIQQITVGIELTRTLGQHYLTLGLPLAAGFVCASSFLFYYKSKKAYKLLLLVVMISSLTALLSLSGRSPVLLSVTIPILIAFVFLVTKKGILEKAKIFFSIVIIGPVSIYFIYNSLPDKLMNRLQRITTGNEPRELIYRQSIRLIKENPMGYGLKTSELGFSYPHNIFLEVTLSGGIAALAALVVLSIYMLVKIFKSMRIDAFAITSSGLAMVTFITWNISYDLSSSYIPFIAMAVLITAVDKSNHKQNELLEHNAQ